MVAVEAVVAIGGDDEGRHVHPAREKPKHVEGRLVAPVQILDHEHGRLLGELVAERPRTPPRAALRRRACRRAHRTPSPRRAAARAARRRERVAGTRRAPGRRAVESARRRRGRALVLPAPASPPIENDSSVAEPGLVERFGQHARALVALEQLVRPAARVEREAHRQMMAPEGQRPQAPVGATIGCESDPEERAMATIETDPHDRSARRSSPTPRSTSSTRGRCRTRSTRSRSPAPRGAISGTTTGTATWTSPRSSSTSTSATSTRRSSRRSRTRPTSCARSGRRWRTSRARSSAACSPR